MKCSKCGAKTLMMAVTTMTEREEKAGGRCGMQKLWKASRAQSSRRSSSDSDMQVHSHLTQEQPDGITTEIIILKVQWYAISRVSLCVEQIFRLKHSTASFIAHCTTKQDTAQHTIFDELEVGG